MVESGSLLRSYAREGIKGSNPFPTDFFLIIFKKRLKVLNQIPIIII